VKFYTLADNNNNRNNDADSADTEKKEETFRRLTIGRCLSAHCRPSPPENQVLRIVSIGNGQRPWTMPCNNNNHGDEGKSASNGCLIFTVRLARSTWEISMNGLTKSISRGKW
jgi:hypothetical protein